MWFGMGELNLIFFFSECLELPPPVLIFSLKMSLVHKMLRRDTAPRNCVAGSTSRFESFLLLSDHTARGVVFSPSVSNYILLCFLILCWFVHAQGKHGQVSPGKTCKHLEEWPYPYQMLLESCTHQFCILIAWHESLSHFCSFILCKTSENKELKICHSE